MSKNRVVFVALGVVVLALVAVFLLTQKKPAPLSAPADEAASGTYYAASEGVYLFAEPRTDQEPIGLLAYGQPVAVVARRGEWYKVDMGLWVQSAEVLVSPPPGAEHQQAQQPPVVDMPAEIAGNPAERRGYGETLRSRFQKEGNKIEVEVSGDVAEVLTLRSPAVDWVWAQNFQNSGFPAELRALGFRKIQLKDDKNFALGYELNQGVFMPGLEIPTPTPAQ